jgi:RsiW-degrading membrane proteinase PrsW (M82 family)
VLNPTLALLPVVLFLSALSLMDTFRLVRPSTIAAVIAGGALAAALSLAFNSWLIHGLHVPLPVVRRALAPAAEETAKALLVYLLISSARIAFLVDAAVLGFAVGTGFGLIENVWYLQALGTASPTLWVVRGFGTAILHGATTTIVAIVARTLADRHPERPALACLPGLGAAILIHGAFNANLLPPVAETLLLLIALPLLVVFIFERSERATREWVGAGLDLDLALYDLMQSPDFAFTRFGRYLGELRSRLPGPMVADMFCLLRLDLELSIQAKALLLAREAGVELPPSSDLDAALEERRYLQESIGAAGLLAIQPLSPTSARDTWHRHLLRRDPARIRGIGQR